jgi:hypothetical protein
MRTRPLSLNPAGESGTVAVWLQRLTVAGSLFFFAKGLVWLAAAFWLLAR